MNPEPAPPTLKRHLSATLEITPVANPVASAAPDGLTVRVRFSVPSASWEMTLLGSIPRRALDERAGADPVGDRVVEICMELVRSGLHELRLPTPGSCDACPAPDHEPGLDEVRSELESLRVKYDALFCSRMGILHD